MYCQHCGAQIPRGGRFCALCGTPVEGTALHEAPIRAPIAVSSEPFDTLTAAEPVKKKRSLVVPILIAIALVIAGIVAAGFFTNWFGLGNAGVRVVSKSEVSTTQDSVSQTVSYTFNRDLRGNVKNVEAAVKQGDEEGTMSVDFTFDDDGVPLSMTFTEEEDDVHIFTVESTKDDKGRVTEMSYIYEGERITNATYEYDGDGDNVRAITYSGDANAALAYYSTLSVGNFAPFISYAVGSIATGYDCRIVFDAEGNMVSYTYAGTTVQNTTPSRETRAGQTISDGNDSYSVTYTFDKYGQVESSETKMGDTYTQTTTNEFEQVLVPSRWIAMIGRLG